MTALDDFHHSQSMPADGVVTRSLLVLMGSQVSYRATGRSWYRVLLRAESDCPKAEWCSAD